MKYVPILKWKQGEWQALGGLPPEAADQIIPLMELTPSTEAAASPEEHVRNRVLSLSRRWSSEAFADVNLLEEHDAVPPAEAFSWLQDATSTTDLVLIPTTALSDPAMAEAAADAATAVGRLCLRLLRRDMLLMDIDQRVADALSRSDLDESAVDVVVDLQDQVDELEGLSMVQRLPRLRAWRSVALAGGEFSRPQGSGRSSVAREHLSVARAVDRQVSERTILYADYGPLEAIYAHITGYVEVVPQIVYTTNDAWLVERGRIVSRYGWEQTQELAARIAADPAFAGAAFSPGDQWISDRAAGAGGHGNSMKLTEVKVSHHITHVVRRDV